MEKDDEISGVKGSHYTTEFRGYDASIGRWISIDPSFVEFPGYSPYVFSLNNPILFNDPQGDKPPRIKDVIKRSMKSETFLSLMNQNNITIKNCTDKIHYVRGNPAYNYYKDEIYINVDYDYDEIILGITHEMTNKSNRKRFLQLSNQVKSGEISAKEFALKAIYIELEGVTNKIIVSAELDLDVDTNKDLVQQYQNGEISKEDITNTLMKHAESAENATTGKKVLDSYIQRGKDKKSKQLLIDAYDDLQKIRENENEE